MLRPDTLDLEPGRVALREKAVLVGTGSHAVELTRIQPSGKKMMTAADWVRGQTSLESMVFE
jgi:methionyl-tRNA formyltransferase